MRPRQPLLLVFPLFSYRRFLIRQRRFTHVITMTIYGLQITSGCLSKNVDAGTVELS
jgi:hypothetical protein